MKRIMFALGVAAPILILAGAAFKVNHWPGAGIILTLAILMIGLFFLPIFVMVRIREAGERIERLSGLSASCLKSNRKFPCYNCLAPLCAITRGRPPASIIYL